MEELNEYLLQVVQSTRKCNHCALRHDDGTCFFAYDCIKHDFYYYNEGDEENECVSEKS